MTLRIICHFSPEGLFLFFEIYPVVVRGRPSIDFTLTYLHIPSAVDFPFGRKSSTLGRPFSFSSHALHNDLRPELLRHYSSSSTLESLLPLNRVEPCSAVSISHFLIKIIRSFPQSASEMVLPVSHQQLQFSIPTVLQLFQDFISSEV